jgi:hypothetical protein
MKIPPKSFLGQVSSTRQWCQSLVADPQLSRLKSGRFDRFDGMLSPLWWPRYLAGKPSTDYLSPDQRPKHYLPFLKAEPWWCEDEYLCEIRKNLEADWTVILDEFRNLQDYCRPYPTEPGRVEGVGWNSLWLYHGHFYEKMAQRCPRTLELAQGLNHCGDSLGGVFFSVLKAGTTIKPHFGPTNARLRLHLGLDIPNDCWLEVAGERRAWKQGECLLFDDSFLHQACNESETDRVVLIVDLWHPELRSEEAEALKKGWETWGPLAHLKP